MVCLCFYAGGAGFDLAAVSVSDNWLYIWYHYVCKTRPYLQPLDRSNLLDTSPAHVSVRSGVGNLRVHDWVWRLVS